MEVILILLGGAVAFLICMVIVEPYRFFPEMKPKKKFVGSTYWGAYAGTPAEEPAERRTIEIKKACRKERYIAGSSTYAKGRGVNMSGRG
ncbi:MAG TPA: hypothetical protein V6C72_14425 [Chroococcales cyanobacterium]